MRLNKPDQASADAAASVMMESMRVKLTLRLSQRTHNFEKGDYDSLYDVCGLPTGERASVAENAKSRRWQILRTKDAATGDWTGDYETAQDALAVLQKEY
jgi:hypothetical protein